MKRNKPDFGGYATKANLKCSDGRMIKQDAFKDNDGTKVPLVFQHVHNDQAQVVGHAILENRHDGVYAYGYFNNTAAGKNSKELVEHGDITALSIYANGLVQKGLEVVHGVIREVSLVLSGANPGAIIDNFAIQHEDGGYVTDETEAMIHTGLEFEEVADVQHADDDDEPDDEPDDDEDNKTVEEVLETLNYEQEVVVMGLIGAALEEGKAAKDDVEHNNKGGDKTMKKNVFDNSQEEHKGAVLTHDQFTGIVETAKKCGSFKEAFQDFIEHADTYGINDIEILFPDAQKIRNTPDLIKRRTEWVNGVIGGAKHTPFSRIKSVAANLTADEARAKGYMKGNKKKEEVISLLQRVTTPTTIYKKQKLDRDDIVDITDMDVVAWLKVEMRLMLEEEMARAILIGDGREIDDDDKIKEDHLRPIWTDDELYAPKFKLQTDATVIQKMDAILRIRKNYKGSGNPTFYTTSDFLTDMLLVRNKNDDRLYKTEAEVAAAIRVNKIVEVEVMENVTRETEEGTLGLVGIMYNEGDYTIGADKGGEVNFFDDFDIDYNQYKYLLETRISGCLTIPNSALVIEEGGSGTGDAGTGDAGTGGSGTGDAGTGDAGTGDGGDAGTGGGDEPPETGGGGE